MKMLSIKLLQSLLLIVLITIFEQQLQWAVEAQQVPCYFIFGDSYTDSGNNNNLNTIAKANYLPYGIDFPLGPTGRVCNGRLSTDIIGNLLGFSKFIPPFATAFGPDILKGVNYGSGSSGILKNTAYFVGQRINLDEQLNNHQQTITKIEGMIGKPATDYLLHKCIYTVNMGTNDYIANYFMPKAFPTSQLYTPDAFASLLIQRYEQQLRTLYRQGARKVAVFGLGELGCLPFELSRFPTYGQPCVEKINVAVAIFNDKLKVLLAQLNLQLPGAKFTYLGVYRTAFYRSLLDKVGTCCEINKILGTCLPLGKTCPVRNGKLYWDAIHPSEGFNREIATAAYKAQIPDDASPYDISQLAALI